MLTDHVAFVLIERGGRQRRPDRGAMASDE
jgi:hypothetical protein